MKDVSIIITIAFIGFVFGMFVMSITRISEIGTTVKDIEKIRQAEQDCTIKEYYYIDNHRDFCDLIGVNP